jgi:hypothetical protein
MNATATPLSVRGTLWLFATVVLFASGALLVHGPIPQDPGYHLFADARALLGVPNFWNVVSNLPFVVAGVAGLIALAGHRPPGVIEELRTAYVLLFVGSIGVGFGSGAYHFAPSNDTLVWDRLPMTIAFMAFFTIVLGEHLSASLAKRALWPLVLLGIGSVAWWAHTDDLRAYALVQFAPVLILPVMLMRHPSRFATTWPLWIVIASYVVAKLLEHWDDAIYAALGFSGHPLKHVAASVGLFGMLAAMRRRERASCG